VTQYYAIAREQFVLGQNLSLMVLSSSANRLLGRDLAEKVHTDAERDLLQSPITYIRACLFSLLNYHIITHGDLLVAQGCCGRV
jgi:hypothetical protein